MKKNFAFVLTIFLSSLCIPLFCQVENVWIGGSPGHETDWNYFKNWSTGYIPDWTSDVIIPEQHSIDKDYPYIGEGVHEVNSLTIQGSAYLEICNNCELEVLNDFGNLAHQKIQNNTIANQPTLYCQNTNLASIIDSNQ
jgi:hypothetical protein